MTANDPNYFFPSIVIGGWLLTLFAYGYYFVASRRDARRDKLEWLREVRKSRTLRTAAVFAVVLAGVTLLATDGQPVSNPCDSCAHAEGWLWFFLMCWTCP